MSGAASSPDGTARAPSGSRSLDAVAAEVQHAVDAGDWTLAASLEIEFRETLAQQVETLREADAPALRRTLEAAAVRVAHLIGEVAHHERRLVREASMISTGRRAAAAYAMADRAAGED